MKVCPLCNSDAFSPLMECWDSHHFGVCNTCGFNYTSPVPDASELQTIYQKFAQSYPASELARENSDFSSFARDRHQFVISRQPKPSRLLEVGSSYGLFLKLFKDSSWEIYGVEPSLEPALYSKSQFGLTHIQNCMLEDACFEKNSFDIVCSFHVIEHSRDPLAMLKTMRQLIKDTGRLFIATPNLSVLTPNIIQYHFIHHGLHLNLFTPQTMESALARAGFSLEWCQQETDRPAETGSMIIEAKPAKVSLKIFPEEARHARAYGNALYSMQDRLRQQVGKWIEAGLSMAVYGAGAHTRGVFDCLGTLNPNIRVIFDDDPTKSGHSISGIPIRPFSPEDCQGIDLILVSSLAAEQKIMKKLACLAQSPIQCYGIYRDILKKNNT